MMMPPVDSLPDVSSSPRRRSWQVPKYGSASRQDVRTWAKQQVDDGRSYREASPGYEQLEESIRILSGKPTAELKVRQQDNRYSKVHTQRAKRNLREMVNALSDVRLTPGFHADNNEVQDTAATLNKVAAAWYVNTFADLKIKKAVQWMAITPAGWLEICYRKGLGRRGERDIDLIPHSDFDIVQTGISESGDHQESYTVTIIKDLPVYQAHALWPEWQDRLVPDRETPRGWMEKIKERASDVINDVFGVGEPNKATARNPTCRLYYMYVLDLSVNRGKTEMRMGYEKKETGEVETPWSYKVPYVGQPVLRGWAKSTIDGADVPDYRPATPEECRIFPGRRLVVWADSIVNEPVYDGPMFDWHGMVPLIKFSADEWPFGSFSMLHDVAPVHETINELDRIAHQTVRNRFDPTLLYSILGITREKAKVLRADVQGQRVGVNTSTTTLENTVRPLLPKDFNEIDDWVHTFKMDLQGELDYEMGVRDISSLAKLKIGATPDSLEKAMEMVGPITKGIAREMERQVRDLAEMFKYLVFQYYTTPKIMKITGVDGLTSENFDFKPGNLIPSHLPGERKEKPSVYTDMQRSHWMADHAPFVITPNTIHEFITAQMKLIYLQLSGKGFPISPYTMADVMRIPNFATIPEGANTELEKWAAFQRWMLEFKASLSKEARELAEVEGLGEENPNQPNAGPRGGPKGTGGRAPANTAMPKMQQKGDGRPVARSSP